jgi:hypothetical protein
MTRFDDEPTYACAWGRWRIGPALNEPMMRRRPRERGDPVSLVRKALDSRFRGNDSKARLHLVAGTGRMPETPR